MSDGSSGSLQLENQLPVFLRDYYKRRTNLLFWTYLSLIYFEAKMYLLPEFSWKNLIMYTAYLRV